MEVEEEGKEGNIKKQSVSGHQDKVKGVQGWLAGLCGKKEN